jgi:hypothetical protein
LGGEAVSVDLSVGVVGKTKQEILDLVKKKQLGIRGAKKDWSDFYVAGFGYKMYEGKEYTDSEIEEAKKEGWFKSHMDLECVRLSNTTNMGWSYYGDSRQLQFPVAEMLAQVIAMYLNCMTFVKDPQSGTVVYYRRKDHTMIHDVLDERTDSFRFGEFENFCESRHGDNGEWEELGWRAKKRKTGA